MRKLIVALSLLTLNANAQPEIDKRWRIGSKFSCSYPLGDFSIKSSKQNEIGPFRAGYGGGFAIGKSIYKNVFLSFSFNYESFGVDSGRILQIYKDRYIPDAKFYTEVTGSPRFEMGSAALELSYRFVVSPFEIEPFFRAGIGFPQVHSNIYINKKMVNDHYTETIRILPESTDFLYSSVGTYVNIPISPWFYGFVSGGYSWGNFVMGMTEEKKDFWGSQTETTYTTIYQRVSAVQLQAGFQIRLGKIPKKHIETDEAKH